MALHDRDYMRETPGARHAPGGITAFQALMGLNLVVFLAQYVFETGWLRHPLTGELVMPLGGVSAHELGRGNAWTLLTHMFVHGGVGHFLLNMLMLLFTGRAAQQFFGGFHLVLIYFGSGILGAAAEMAVNAWAHDDTLTPLIGASGSVFGLLLALAVAMPQQQITAMIYFIIPVHLRLWTLAKALCVIQLVLGMVCALFDFLPEGLRIAYFAHLGGAAFGWFHARWLGYGASPLARPGQWQPEPLSRAPALARARRRALPDHEEDAQETARPPARRADPIECLIEEVVNPLLDKINLLGYESLTEDEKRRLEDASREVSRHRQS